MGGRRRERRKEGPEETGAFSSPFQIKSTQSKSHSHLVPRLQQEHQAQLARRVLSQGLSDRDEVLERLGHLQALDVQVPGVEEVVDPLVVSKARLALSKLVVVVRELCTIFAWKNGCAVVVVVLGGGNVVARSRGCQNTKEQK